MEGTAHNVCRLMEIVKQMTWFLLYLNMSRCHPKRIGLLKSTLLKTEDRIIRRLSFRYQTLMSHRMRKRRYGELRRGYYPVRHLKTMSLQLRQSHLLPHSHIMKKTLYTDMVSTPLLRRMMELSPTIQTPKIVLPPNLRAPRIVQHSRPHKVSSSGIAHNSWSHSILKYKEVRPRISKITMHMDLRIIYKTRTVTPRRMKKTRLM